MHGRYIIQTTDFSIYDTKLHVKTFSFFFSSGQLEIVVLLKEGIKHTNNDDEGET